MRTTQAARVMAILTGISTAVGMGSCGGSSSPDTWSISGTVSGPVSQGVTVTLAGASSAAATTDATGSYSFPGLENGSYSVTPLFTGCSFTPASRSVTINGANVAEQDFSASAVSHLISGWVSGAARRGVTVTLGGASSASTTTSDSGYYKFAELANGDYTVTPSLAGYTFYPANRPVTVSDYDRLRQDFIDVTSTCSSEDVATPSVPSGVTVGGMSCMALVHWQVSSDDTGVVSYAIYHASAPSPLAVVDGTNTMYVVGGFHPPYPMTWTICYEVSARDCAGHESQRSAVACGTVSWRCGGDI
jgi:hypothetical protein